MREHLTRSKTGLVRSWARSVSKFVRQPMHFPTYGQTARDFIETAQDDVRYASLALAISRLQAERINGALAEVGVYRGHTSRFMHSLAPDRPLFLFDTFAGFPSEIVDPASDGRFRDTSQESVARFIGDLNNVVFRPGYFPRTAEGLEDEEFALVMLDCDLYQTALDGLRFFYPRLVPGGYFFLHDFNSPESDYAIARAAHEFLANKPEGLIEVPDQWGSAVFRKSRVV